MRLYPRSLVVYLVELGKQVVEQLLYQLYKLAFTPIGYEPNKVNLLKPTGKKARTIDESVRNGRFKSEPTRTKRHGCRRISKWQPISVFAISKHPVKTRPLRASADWLSDVALCFEYLKNGYKHVV